MSDQRIRGLQRRIAADPSDLEAAAQLGVELQRSIDIIGLITGLSEDIQAAIAASYVKDDAVERVVAEIDITAEDVAAHFSASEIADEIDTGDIAYQVSMEVNEADIASEIDVSNIASEIDVSDIANAIDVSDIASEIDTGMIDVDLDALAAFIDIDDLAQRVKDLM